MAEGSLFLSFYLLLLFSFSIKAAVVELRQEDFTQGTYIIDSPGTYKLVEDISFNPNSVEFLNTEPYFAGDVQPSQYTFAGGIYDPAAYGIGFFAAISIYGRDVVLDLNGFTLAQSLEHSLQQRFFALIELADQPFLVKQGPHDFDGGSGNRAAENVVIKNGALGRSSHHAIHCNECVNVTVTDLEIYDFEVAAIALNGVQGLSISNIHILRAQQNSPVLGLYSASRFMRPYVEYLVEQDADTTLTVQGELWTAQEIRDALKQVLDDVFEDIVVDGRRTIDENQHPVAYSIYHNELGLVDGNQYGILLNRPGVAVNGFPHVPDDPARFVLIENVRIENLANHMLEVPVLVTKFSKPLLDPVGAVFQVFNTHPDTHEPLTLSSCDMNGRFIGNPIANAQAFVGKAILEGKFDSANLPISNSGTNHDLLDWIESGAELSTYLDKYGTYCNGDVMFHVDKGLIAMKIDAASSVTVRDVRITNITNYGYPGSLLCNYNWETFSHPNQTTPGFGGADTRAFSFSGSVGIVVSNALVEDVESKHGSAYGFEVLQDSHDIDIVDCKVTNVKASLKNDVKDYGGDTPNKIPEAFGFYSGPDSSFIDFDGYSCEKIKSIGTEGDVKILGSSSSATPADGNESTSSSSTIHLSCLFSFALLFLL